MTDWFVDGSISGGNGTAPNTAFPSIRSITWSPGDRAWVRNTHVDSILSTGVWLGPNWNNHGFSRMGFLIGWPQSDMPFYDDRPASGIAAGWDSDVPSTSTYSSFGYKFPTLVCSKGTRYLGPIMPVGGIIANMYLDGNMDNVWAWSNTHDMVEDPMMLLAQLDNVMPTLNGGMFSQFNESLGVKANKLIVAASLNPLSAGTVCWKADIEDCKHLVIHQKSVIPALFRNTNNLNIGLLEIQTTSLGILYRDEGGIQTPNAAVNYHIRRVSGIRPYSSFVGSGAGAKGAPLSVDDYFGEGPKISHGEVSRFRVASNNEAQHNGLPTTYYDIRSRNFNFASYMRGHSQYNHIYAAFDVVSGTPIEIRVPIYVDSTAVFSPTSGLLTARLLAAGTQMSICNASKCLPGTPSLWTGSLIAGGSAYLWSCVFTPTETNSQVQFEVSLPPFTQATSGQGLTSYALFGEPYKA